MKYLIILCLSSLLIACSNDPSDYDYNLREDQVLCKEVKREDKQGRYGTVTVKITKLCSFISTEHIDKAQEVQLNTLKATVENAQKELDVKNPE